ncbi:hypothetical protein DAEQUDRAFT_400820 [Daedalea quercina L-15889]|uniref:Uncharacterized protein n=1 Tax=Daedalea quercina L-15889 TaxID=1314783 RepID=A0A165NQF7_9APHY|nr:hypothetical protein DAEQUDRAFT_400820 [Daedalea quercina L-15889]
MKLLFGRSIDDAELLEARSFDDEDLYARDFDEDLYAREYDDELFERELDDEFWARGDEQPLPHQHSHHHNGIPPQANNPTKADRKELGVFPNQGEGAEAKEHTHTDNSFSGAQHPMQGVHPKRAFIDELRERMDFYDELD